VLAEAADQIRSGDGQAGGFVEGLGDGEFVFAVGGAGLAEGGEGADVADECAGGEAVGAVADMREDRRRKRGAGAGEIEEDDVEEVDGFVPEGDVAEGSGDAEGGVEIEEGGELAGEVEDALQSSAELDS